MFIFHIDHRYLSPSTEMIWYNNKVLRPKQEQAIGALYWSCLTHENILSPRQNGWTLAHKRPVLA